MTAPATDARAGSVGRGDEQERGWFPRASIVGQLVALAGSDWFSSAFGGSSSICVAAFADVAEAVPPPLLKMRFHQGPLGLEMAIPSSGGIAEAVVRRHEVTSKPLDLLKISSAVPAFQGCLVHASGPLAVSERARGGPVGICCGWLPRALCPKGSGRSSELETELHAIDFLAQLMIVREVLPRPGQQNGVRVSDHVLPNRLTPVGLWIRVGFADGR